MIGRDVHRMLAAKHPCGPGREVFHGVEKIADFFHTMEKVFGIFPHNGNGRCRST
jgi:hypothetical protein